jgi:uncharacterized protein (DUF2141 family)
MKHALHAAPLLALLTTGAFPADATLRVVGTNLRSDAGSFIVWVYDDPDTWLSDNWRTRKMIPVAGNREGDTITLELTLPPGEYALSVYQDMDDDGKLARNFIGIPKEPAGLSNNVRPRFGAPKFRDAKFTLGDGPVEQRIRLE